MPNTDTFTSEERRLLTPYFTNLDGPVFALVNLPEVVKGALFARYSRSPKSLRRLFLDEFLAGEQIATAAPEAGLARSLELYDRVFLEYGDDSVAQLGSAHIACEGVSNVLTKILERGRIMSYLEQSTRYIPFTDRPDGRWKYTVPAEIVEYPQLHVRYERCLDHAFETYARLLPLMRESLSSRFVSPEDQTSAALKRAVRAKALDSLRGLLPAATRSNMGIYGSGQAYEALLLRMRSHPLAEARAFAGMILGELRKVIPAFVKRIDLPERGELWTRYLAETRREIATVADELVAEAAPVSRDEVTLTDFDPDGELKVAAAALYPSTRLPDDQLLALARSLSHEQRLALLRTYVGERRNRRHRPGRAFERTSYRFDVLTDYGAFRDLQRHRLLTIDWQPLSVDYGYVVPPEVEAGGFLNDWSRVMAEAADLHHEIVAAGLPEVAPYAVPMAYRIRFYLEMNAREAMHVIELRTSPQGHPSYRRVCQRMHALIRDGAGHGAIAEAMRFADHSSVELERLEAETAMEKRRASDAADVTH